MNEVITYREVKTKLLQIQGLSVLLDRDVAELYGVETKRINEAVKNNPDKFPEGYLVAVSDDEKVELVENFDRFDALKHSTVAPTAFTEKGLYMLATILKSPKAVTTTIAIVETFAKIRELKEAVSLLPETKEESQKKELMQRSGEILIDILDDDELEVSGDETTIEFDLAFVKLKHTVKRSKRKKQ
jgi:hypothetical protein